MPQQIVRPNTVKHKLFACTVGLFGQAIFLFAICVMMEGIYYGLHRRNAVHGLAAPLDLVLVLQFPILHSWLLSSQGRRLLKSLSPREIAADMTSTWFALIASAQLLLTFLFWMPLGQTIYQPHGYALTILNVLYAASWIFLAKTMYDADATLQSGLKGWVAVVCDRRPNYQAFPEHGTFSVCRQPIYLAFALILCTAPVWTTDRAVLCAIWLLYCYLGPRFKEQRNIALYGDRYRDYQSKVPYFFPQLRRSRQ